MYCLAWLHVLPAFKRVLEGKVRYCETTKSKLQNQTKVALAPFCVQLSDSLEDLWDVSALSHIHLSYLQLSVLLSLSISQPHPLNPGWGHARVLHPLEGCVMVFLNICMYRLFINRHVYL